MWQIKKSINHLTVRLVVELLTDVVWFLKENGWTIGWVWLLIGWVWLPTGCTITELELYTGWTNGFVWLLTGWTKGWTIGWTTGFVWLLTGCTKGWTIGWTTGLVWLFTGWTTGWTIGWTTGWTEGLVVFPQSNLLRLITSPFSQSFLIQPEQDLTQQSL